MFTQNVKWNRQSLALRLENLPPICSIAKQQFHSRLRARRLAQRGTIAFQFHSPSIPLLRHINHQQIFHLKDRRRLFPACLPCWSRSRTPRWQPLHGTHMLTMSWHSGSVFGLSASASAVSKLLDLNSAQIEGVLGIACT
jgi:hypothetical protein